VTSTYLVLQAFRQPESLAKLSLPEWDLLVRQARVGDLLANLYLLLEERGLAGQIPPQAREHFEWARIFAERHSQAVEWEVSQIQKALAGVGIPLILLKGAAYVMAGFPRANARLFSDVDILVPKKCLNAVEAALMLHGWASTHLDEYDQRYYRTWMHELPPMQHIRRMSSIDVHHAILPETAPLRPDPEKLRAAAQRIEGHKDLMVLAPADMVLHSAVHLMHGEMDNGLRDLIDIDILVRHFGTAPSFWMELVARAKELELVRPLFYVLRYAKRLLYTPIPVSAIEAADAGKPGRLTLALMDQFVQRAVMPDHASMRDIFTKPARHILYVRANWLRMPPLLLARHLFHKAFLSPKPE
jgi:hypothetical protein